MKQEGDMTPQEIAEMLKDFKYNVTGCRVPPDRNMLAVSKGPLSLKVYLTNSWDVQIPYNYTYWSDEPADRFLPEGPCNIFDVKVKGMAAPLNMLIKFDPEEYVWDGPNGMEVEDNDIVSYDSTRTIWHQPPYRRPEEAED